MFEINLLVNVQKVETKNYHAILTQYESVVDFITKVKEVAKECNGTYKVKAFKCSNDYSVSVVDENGTEEAYIEFSLSAFTSNEDVMKEIFSIG